MNIGELYVNLGLKGNDQVAKGLTGVKAGLGDVKSMSLEAKAAILGVMYGLERLMTQSAQMGSSLMNFNELTGISAKSLQEWQYAARQAGVGGEELTGSMKSVQSAMTNMLLGKGAPEGLAMVANKVGFDENRARDTLYVMKKLQEFAQVVPKDVGNNMLKSFGLSEGTISAMRRNMFTDNNFKKAPTYSEKEIANLDRVNVAWSNLGQKIQMAIGHLTSKHGLELANDFARVTAEVFKMVEAFTKLAEKIKLLEGIGKLFEGWGTIFEGISNAVSGVGDMIDDVTKDKKGVFHGVMQEAGKLTQGVESAVGTISAGMSDVSGEPPSRNKHHMAPQMRPMVKSSKVQHIEVNQNLNFQHDGKDHQKTSTSVHKAVKDAYRQYQAQAQGS